MSLVQLLALSALTVGGNPREETPPNLVARVSAALVNDMVARPVDRTTEVQEDILGTWYSGLSRTCGQFHAELVDDPDRATLDLVLTGVAAARTVGYRGAFQVYTQSVTPLEARKRLSFDRQSYWNLPATAVASTHSEILAITDERGQQHSLPVILARVRACQQQPESESVASTRTATRAAEQLDCDVNPDIDRAVQAIGDALATARRAGLSPQPPRWSSTREHLDVRIAFPTPGETASSPPAALRSADLVVGLHQGIIDAVVREPLGGKTFKTSEQGGVVHDRLKTFFRGAELDSIRQQVEQVARILDEHGLGTLTITLDQDRPASIRFTEGKITVVLHASGFADRWNQYPAADIRVVYRIEKTDDGFVLVRQAPIQLIRATRTIAAVLLQFRLGLTLNLVFAPRLPLGPVVLPSSSGARRIVLSPQRVESQDGWLQLSWTRPVK